MPLFTPRLSLFSLTLFILSLYTIKASDSDPTRPLTFPETISIPQYQNYSIDLSSCYDSGVSRIFINDEKSSRLFYLIETQSEDIQYIHDIHSDTKPTLASFRPWLVLNTSEIGSFVANIETFTKNTPLCSFKINVNVIDPKGHDCPGIAYHSNLEAVKSGKSSLEILFPESSCRRDLLKPAIKGPKGAFIYKERLGAPIELGKEKLLHIQQDLEIPGRFVIYTKGADSQKIFMKTCIINDNHADIQCESQELNAFRLKASVKDFKTVNSFVVFTVEEFSNTLIAYWNRPVEGKNLAVPLHGGLCDSFDTFDSLTEMYLFCISKDSVKVWDAKIQSLDATTIIDAGSLGLSSFKPMMVQALPGRAGTVVIKTPDEILLVKLSFSKDRKCELLSTIKVLNGDYTFVVNGDHLVILSEDGNTAMQYDIQDSKAPRLINTCTECHDLNLKEGIAKSAGSCLFAISTADRVNIYNTRVPGFMNTFSSLNLDDQSSKMAEIISLDTASNLMFIHSADENTVTLQRIYQTPAFYPAPKSTKPRTGPIRDNLKDNSVLMVPQGYSPIGFALFIIAIVYIVIIFICIGRRIIKTRRMQRIADEQAAIMLPQEEGGEPVPPIAENVDIGVNNQGEGQQGRNNDNRYVAINDDDSTRIDASNS